MESVLKKTNNLYCPTGENETMPLLTLLRNLFELSNFNIKTQFIEKPGKRSELRRVTLG